MLLPGWVHTSSTLAVAVEVGLFFLFIILDYTFHWRILGFVKLFCMAITFRIFCIKNLCIISCFKNLIKDLLREITRCYNSFQLDHLIALRPESSFKYYYNVMIIIIIIIITLLILIIFNIIYYYYFNT